MSKPKVIITIDRGYVTSVISDSVLDVAVIIIDHGEPGLFRENVEKIPQGIKGIVNEVYVDKNNVLEINPDRVEQIFGAIL